LKRGGVRGCCPGAIRKPCRNPLSTACKISTKRRGDELALAEIDDEDFEFYSDESAIAEIDDEDFKFYPDESAIAEFDDEDLEFDADETAIAEFDDDDDLEFDDESAIAEFDDDDIDDDEFEVANWLYGKKKKRRKPRRRYHNGAIRTMSYRRSAWCSKGVRNGQACCRRSCGTCGGNGCSKRRGGGKGCCVRTIRKSKRVCTNKRSTACMIPTKKRRRKRGEDLADETEIAEFDDEDLEYDESAIAELDTFELADSVSTKTLDVSIGILAVLGVFSMAYCGYKAINGYLLKRNEFTQLKDVEY